MIVISFGTAVQFLVVAALLALWYLRSLETAHRLEEIREELRALRLAVGGGVPALATPASSAAGLRENAAPSPPRSLPRDELLALGRSLAWQLLRGERTAGTLSVIEEQAVRAYHELPDAEKDFPAVVLRHTKAT